MKYKRQMTKRAAKVMVDAAIRPLCRSEDTRRVLTEHLFQLQNNYAVELAELLHDSVRDGRRPNLEESRVMQGMFERAMDILIKRRPPNPLKGERGM